jgi:hypothetical protein
MNARYVKPDKVTNRQVKANAGVWRVAILVLRVSRQLRSKKGGPAAGLRRPSPGGLVQGKHCNIVVQRIKLVEF